MLALPSPYFHSAFRRIALGCMLVCSTLSTAVAQDARTVTKYFDNDPAAGVKERYTLLNNQLSGTYTTYYRTGVVKERAAMRAGRPEGKTVRYDSQGNISSVCLYAGGKLHGTSTYFEREQDFCTLNARTLERRIVYRQGEPVSETVLVNGLKTGSIENGTYQSVKDGSYFWCTGNKNDYTVAGTIQGSSITGSVGVSLQSDRNGARVNCPLTSVNGLTLLLDNDVLANLTKIADRFRAKYPDRSTPNHVVLHMQGSSLSNQNGSLAYLLPDRIDYVELWSRGEFLLKIPYKVL